MGELTANSAAVPAPAASAGDLSRPVQRRHLEPECALLDHDALQGRACRQAEFNTPYSIPKHGAWAQDGLDVDAAPDAESRGAVGSRVERGSRRSDPGALDGANRPQDWNNVQPRLGFAYSLNDRTVLRGGGRYASPMSRRRTCSGRSRLRRSRSLRRTTTAAPILRRTPSTGRCPAFDQAQKLFCYVNNNAPGCLIRDLMELAPPPGN